jgi:hypothetical protein
MALSMEDRWLRSPIPQVSSRDSRGIRKKLGLSPGQRIEMVVYGDRIELIPVKPVKRMRGFLKGIDTRVPREEDRV